MASVVIGIPSMNNNNYHNNNHPPSNSSTPANSQERRNLTIDSNNNNNNRNSNNFLAPSTNSNGLTSSTSASPLNSTGSHNHTGSFSTSQSSHNLNAFHKSNASCSSALLTPDEHHFHYPCSADDYDIYAEIGVGAFATVYRGVVKETNEEVAIKVIDLDQFNTNWEEIRKEILVMSLLHHPNVVRILTSFVSGPDLWIVMPLLQAGSCAAIMKQLAPTGFKDEALIATILKETLLALVYFHKDRRIHRDLKAGNILIGSDGSVELADFGVAGTLMENGDRKNSHRKTFTGTPCWMAPEVMEHTAGYDEKVDIWSFGITALELGYGRAPYARFQPMKVILLTLQEDPPTSDIYKDKVYEFSKHYHSLIKSCLKKDPEDRPTAKKLLEHKFFKQAKDKNYIVEKLVKKLPPPQPMTEKMHICKEKLSHDHQREELNKPVSIGSWEFDKQEFEDFKKKANEEDPDIILRRKQAIDNSYHQHGNSTPNTPNSTKEQNNNNQNLYNNDMENNNNENNEGQVHEHREGRFFVSDDDNNNNNNSNNNNNNTNGINQINIAQNQQEQLPEFHDQIGLPIDQNNQGHMHFENGEYEPDPNSVNGFNNQNNENNQSNNLQDIIDNTGEHIGRFSIMDEDNQQ